MNDAPDRSGRSRQGRRRRDDDRRGRPDQADDRRRGARERTDDRPMRRARPPVPKPALPDDVTVHLPGNVRRELRQHVRGRELGDEVALAVMLGGDAIDAEDPAGALQYLQWAKEVAPRAPVIREGLAVAHYLAEDYRSALNELRTYRRLSGSKDQDHLLADCLRATGHSTAEVAEVVQGVLDSDVPAERRLEALLVWAGAVADGGDLPAAQAVLRRADRALVDEAGEEGRERLTYVAGDLAERAGDLAGARRAFERLFAIEGDPYEAGVRLASLPEGD